MEVLFFQPVFGSGDFPSINRIHCSYIKTTTFIGVNLSIFQTTENAANLEIPCDHVKPEKSA